MNPRVPALLGLAFALALSGCAQLQQIESRLAKTQQQATKTRDENINNATSSTVVRSSRPRLAGEQVTLRASNALPPLFERRITYATQGAQTLSEVLDALAAMTGLSIVANEIAQPQGGAPTTNGQQAPGSPGVGLQGRVQMEFINGKLRNAFDEIAAKNDASWRYVATSNTVEFFRFETRTLNVSLPRGSKSANSSISLAGVGGGGEGAPAGGGSTTTISNKVRIDPWGSLMAGVQSILGEAESSATGAGLSKRSGPADSDSGAQLTVQGAHGRAAASPDFGIVTVTARPSVVQRVAAYVSAINGKFAQNLMIDVKILNLTLDRASSMGFSMDLVYQRLNGNGLSIVGGAPLTAGSGTPGKIIGTIGNPNSRWNGSELVAQALGQFGDVSVQTHQQVLAVNGQPAPVQIARNIPYMDSRTVATVANVGSTEGATTASRVVGFTANFTPTVQGDNRILLEYNLNIEELVAMESFPVGSGFVQRPRTSVQSLPGQAYVRDGQAIVLFAFDQNRDSLSAAASVAGASKAGRNEREMLIVVIQVYGGLKDV